ncbi:UvrB/UvrC motif-containing protein, partial [bacterium]|nr:UvrB/UvrC motif-containing protein [bacterium]
WSIDTLQDRITSITRFDPTTGETLETPTHAISINPAKHHIIGTDTAAAIKQIRHDLDTRHKELELAGKPVEAYRLKQKVNFDLEQIAQFGFVNGIENYTRYFDGRAPGDPPFTLLDYFWENQKIYGHDGFLTIVDESHMSVPQIRGMYFGDVSRKQNLIKYGFRLPSALDNRPLKWHEFLDKNQQFVFVSATPGEWELEYSHQKVAEQLIRPTGLLDPIVEVRPSRGQIENLIGEILRRKKLHQRVLVTVLTKRMAETLTDYLNDAGRLRELCRQHPEYEFGELEPLPQVAYLHSDVETLERSDILSDLREGKYDCLVGINLLREGLDLPEVSLVAIVDADKEGFLRSETSLVQTIGRAARHVYGRAILYADQMTGSMERAINETKRRRQYQEKFNRDHGITPQTVTKKIRERLLDREAQEAQKNQVANRHNDSSKTKKPLVIQLDKKTAIDLNNFDPDAYTPHELKQLTPKLKRQMTKAANLMDFELAAMLRDLVFTIEKQTEA